MVDNYLTIVKTFVRKNGLRNIISVHTMGLSPNRINYIVETKEEPKEEAIREILTKDISFSISKNDDDNFIGVFVLPNSMENIEIVEKALLVY